MRSRFILAGFVDVWVVKLVFFFVETTNARHGFFAVVKTAIIYVATTMANATAIWTVMRHR
jgi:hypothetical protein